MWLQPSFESGRGLPSTHSEKTNMIESFFDRRPVAKASCREAKLSVNASRSKNETNIPPSVDVPLLHAKPGSSWSRIQKIKNNQSPAFSSRSSASCTRRKQKAPSECGIMFCNSQEKGTHACSGMSDSELPCLAMATAKCPIPQMMAHDGAWRRLGLAPKADCGLEIETGVQRQIKKKGPPTTIQQ